MLGSDQGSPEQTPALVHELTASGEHVSSDAAVVDGDLVDDEGQDPYERARTICLNQLSYCARTRAHLESVLLKRKIPTEVAVEVLDRFTELGLINDAEFARTYAQSRQRSKGLSLRAIQRELRDKGVETEDVDAALAELDEGSESDAARALVQRKLRSLSGVDVQVQTRRLVGMLARKGYSPSLSYAVVREVLGESALETTVLDESAIAND